MWPSLYGRAGCCQDLALVPDPAGQMSLLGVPKHPKGFPAPPLPHPLLLGSIPVALFLGGDPSWVLTSGIGAWARKTAKDCP